MVAQDIGLGDTELEIEDIEVLALDATNVTLAKDTGTKSPVYVLKSGVVEVLE